ncbi:hypothetical protein LCGC14_1966380 [marine sediment metagenome]|uniref:Uncharacterized protein n=1 Tax=marine sediment metagenome TaxID=412755 RepID=A0A0F9G1G2_9ZZZZ
MPRLPPPVNDFNHLIKSVPDAAIATTGYWQRRHLFLIAARDVMRKWLWPRTNWCPQALMLCEKKTTKRKLSIIVGWSITKSIFQRNISAQNVTRMIWKRQKKRPLSYVKTKAVTRLVKKNLRAAQNFVSNAIFHPIQINDWKNKNA